MPRHQTRMNRIHIEIHKGSKIWRYPTKERIFCKPIQNVSPGGGSSGAEKRQRLNRLLSIPPIVSVFEEDALRYDRIAESFVVYFFIHLRCFTFFQFFLDAFHVLQPPPTQPPQDASRGESDGDERREKKKSPGSMEGVTNRLECLWRAFPSYEFPFSGECVGTTTEAVRCLIGLAGLSVPTQKRKSIECYTILHGGGRGWNKWEKSAHSVYRGEEGSQDVWKQKMKKTALWNSGI